MQGASVVKIEQTGAIAGPPTEGCVILHQRGKVAPDGHRPSSRPCHQRSTFWACLCSPLRYTPQRYFAGLPFTVYCSDMVSAAFYTSDAPLLDVATGAVTVT